MTERDGNRIKEKQMQQKNDLLLAFLVLLLALAVFAFQRFTAKDGGVAEVYAEKELLGAYPLWEEKSVVIRRANGGVNHLVIRDGKAWMEEANCPDKLCVKQGSISRDREAITCLPHKVTVVIKSSLPSDVDAVVQ